MGRRLVKTGGILIVAAVAAACVYLVLSCRWHNLEHEEITDSLRQAASGSFAHLSSDGFTHYEIAGLGSSRTVVLIHGFSVPYYLWDKTFDPLRRAGLCVLQYDLYGRGLSDRPHEHYNPDLYDRQLSSFSRVARSNAGGSGGSVHGWFDRGDLCGSTSGESAHTRAVRS